MQLGRLSTYRQFNDKQLASEYFKHVENVTVFEKTPDLKEVNEQLAEKDKQIQELQNEINEVKQLLLEKRIELQEKNGRDIDTLIKLAVKEYMKK